MQKSYLFLQGATGDFFTNIAHSILSDATLLNKTKHIVKVNFNGGDKIFWDIKIANDKVTTLDYTDKIENFTNFIEGVITKYAVTDIFLYNDCRAYHAKTIDVVNEINFNNNYDKLTKNSVVAKNKTNGNTIKFHMFEEGYIRPFYITYENLGLNNQSDLPRNREFYFKRLLSDQKEGKFLAPNDYFKLHPNNLKSFKRNRSGRIVKTFIYCLAMYFMQKKFPHYQNHRRNSLIKESRAWIVKIMFMHYNRLISYYKIKKVIAEDKQSMAKKVFCFALQLSNDSQTIKHSNFKNSKYSLRYVIDSFANNCADNDDILLIKQHPEDDGLDNLQAYCKRLIKKHSENNPKIKNKIIFIKEGSMPKILRRATGFISVNSTAGMSSLIHNVPTICLGNAIYNIEGICYHGKLDDFWQHYSKPNERLFHVFYDYLTNKTQLNGGYYTESAVAIAVDSLFKKIS